jgi:hypothetical protein
MFIITPLSLQMTGKISSKLNVRVYNAFLAFGVTTVFDPSSDNQIIFERAERVRARLLDGPRIFSTGLVMTGFPSFEYHQPIYSKQEALEAVRRQKAFGATGVKSYMQQCRSQTNMLLTAARQENMTVVPEGGMAYFWNIGHFIDGHTTLEHSIPISRAYDDVKSLISNTNTSYTPTLTIAYGDLFGKTYWLSESNLYDNAKFMRFIPEEYKPDMPLYRRMRADPKRDFSFINISTTAHEAMLKGAKILTGSHGEIPGIGLIWEMFMFAQGGFSSYEVMKAATRNPAITHGLFKDLGSIEAGKLADLLVFKPDADVLNDVSRLTELEYVIADGRIFIAEDIKELK